MIIAKKNYEKHELTITKVTIEIVFKKIIVLKVLRTVKTV